MKLSAIRSNYISALSGTYDAAEAENIFSVAAEELLHERSPAAHADVTAELLSEFDAVLLRLQKNEPVQYIFQKAWFGELPLFVNEHVLIPRPETEELCQLILRENGGQQLRVMDIGTGSGCIPAYLGMQRPDWEFLALDRSAGALEVAKKNMEDLSMQDRVEFGQIDFLQQFPDQDFDLLISNPPYISEEESESMQAHVLDWEPHSALFTGTGDALVFYRRIAELLELSGKRRAWMEINPKFGPELLQIFSKWDAGIIEDIYGRSRFLRIK